MKQACPALALGVLLLSLSGCQGGVSLPSWPRWFWHSPQAQAEKAPEQEEKRSSDPAGVSDAVRWASWILIGGGVATILARVIWTTAPIGSSITMAIIGFAGIELAYLYETYRLWFWVVGAGVLVAWFMEWGNDISIKRKFSKIAGAWTSG